MKENILSVEGLSHFYGKVKAVDNVSFNVEEGQIFSFLGPNGAGKTTIINLLTTLLQLQTGKVTLSGFDLQTQQNSVRQSIGIVFQEGTLDADLTVWETMEFHGRIYSISKTVREQRIQELLDVVELADKKKALVKTLSGGMKRRLEIARGLLTRPKLLFLDEPTIGLDIYTRMKIWSYMKKVNKEGVTIFLTTHYMDEADQLSDTICIMDKGKIITQGTSENLKAALGQDVIYLETNNNEQAADAIKSMPEVKMVQVSSKGLTVSLYREGAHLIPKVIEKIKNTGLEVESVNLKKPTLDDVFVHFTGRGLKEENQDWISIPVMAGASH
jgi:ABC-2 type transport system ATP-binding protein